MSFIIGLCSYFFCSPPLRTLPLLKPLIRTVYLHINSYLPRPSRPEPIFYFFCWVCLYSLDLNRSELHSIYITVIFFHAVLVPFFYSLAQCWNWYTNICTFIYSHMLYIICNCLVALMINNRPNPGLEKFRRPAASRLDYIFPLCYSLLSSITSTTC